MLGALAGGGARFSLALVTDSVAVPDNAFTTASSFSCAPPSTPLWLTGLEHGHVSAAGGGSFSELTGSGASADVAVARSGAYSLKVVKTASASTHVLRRLTGSASSVVTRFAIRLETLPKADVTQLVSFTLADGGVVDLGYQASAQKLQLGFAGGTPGAASVSATAGTWYVIDVKVVAGLLTRTADWRIDGTAQTQASSLLALLGTTVTGLRLGSGTGADVFTGHYDDIVATSNGADYPIGDGKILPLRPNAMDTHDVPGNFQDASGGTITAGTYTDLDDVPVDTGTDHVKQVVASGTSYLGVAFEDATKTCINGVAAVVGFEASTTNENNGKTSAFDGTTETVVYSGAMNPAGRGYKAAVIAPASSSWSQAALNGLVMRIGYSTDVDPQPQWHTLLIEYDVR